MPSTENSSDSRTGTAADDPTILLEADHRRVEHLLEQIDDEASDTRIAELVEQLRQELTSHMEIEEQIVYPVMREIDPELAEEAEVEHELARTGLAQMVTLAGEPGFGAALDMVRAGIDHHVEEEESEHFPELRSELEVARLQAMATAIREARAAAGLPPTSAAELAEALEAHTKSDLTELAQEQNVAGRSSMSKSDLVDSLSDS